MPMYEYRCTECGRITEFLESSSARGPHACEHCGSKKTEKAFSTFAAQMGGGRSEAPACEGQCRTGACPFSQ